MKRNENGRSRSLRFAAVIMIMSGIMMMTTACGSEDTGVTVSSIPSQTSSSLSHDESQPDSSSDSTSYSNDTNCYDNSENNYYSDYSYEYEYNDGDSSYEYVEETPSAASDSSSSDSAASKYEDYSNDYYVEEESFDDEYCDEEASYDDEYYVEEDSCEDEYYVEEDSYDESEGAGCGEDETPVIEADYDYAEDASVRTNETEIRVSYPTVGATDATLRADVLNRTGGTVTMAGITVYSDMGEVIATDYQACSQSGGDMSISYSLRSDLGLVLERGRTYYYRFAVMNDGELFTHDRADFRTVEVDDTFAFELMQPEIGETQAVISAKVMNPSNAHATIAGCKLYTPQGALMAEQEIGIDTTDPEFTLSFNFDNDGEKLPEAKDYEFQVYIRYNGETYTSNYGSFTTLP